MLHQFHYSGYTIYWVFFVFFLNIISSRAFSRTRNIMGLISNLKTEINYIIRQKINPNIREFIRVLEIGTTFFQPRYIFKTEMYI